MVSYLLRDLSTLVYGEEEDDPMCLKDPVLTSIYEQPHKALGLTAAQTKPWEIRDAFRTNCLRLLGPTYFNKMDKALLPYKYALIAWHLLSKTLMIGKAQDLKKALDEKPRYFSGSAHDILHVLRPVRSFGIPMNPAVRACGWLTVIFVEALFALPDGEKDMVAMHQTYVLRVIYCGRAHVVRKRYSDFADLHDALTTELLMVPGFPEKSWLFKVGGGDWNERGEALAAYASRVHASLAARGVFSPRLTAFLGIDAARVHIEEDGRISKFLDSSGAQQGSVWHMVEETWLKRWRKFALSRGARRYEPPGPITNELLLYPRDPSDPGHDAYLATLEEQRMRARRLLKGRARDDDDDEDQVQLEEEASRDDSKRKSPQGIAKGEKKADDDAEEQKTPMMSKGTTALVVAALPKRRVARFHPAPAREIRQLAAKENRHVYVPPGATSIVDFYGTASALEDASFRGDYDAAASGLFFATTGDHHHQEMKGRDATTSRMNLEAVTIGRHYRAVNYNLWAYWKMVHGGGPCISRKNKEITSPAACGSGAEAVSRLQRFGRVCVAKNRKLAKYWHRLSKTAPGVREVLIEFEESRLKKRAKLAIDKSKAERTKSRLRDAALYTQRSWRAKKAYAFNDDNVRVQKHAQEVFATADGEVEHAAPGAPFVVEEGEPIVRTGHVERFDLKLSDADGPALPFTLKKHSCSELTFVQTVDYQRLGVDPPETRKRRRRQREMRRPFAGASSTDAGSMGLDSSTYAFDDDDDANIGAAAASTTTTTAGGAAGGPDAAATTARATTKRQREQLAPDCVLAVVQNYPVSSLTHKQAMGRLTAAKWPLVLRFEKPIGRGDVAPFVDLCRDERARLEEELGSGSGQHHDDERGATLGELSEDLKLQRMKRLLHAGVPLVKYGRQGRAHETVLYVNETTVFWRAKGAERAKAETPYLSLKYDLTRGLPLYDLKYVRINKVSPVFRSAVGADRADPDRCFTVFAEGRTLDLEVAYLLDNEDDFSSESGDRQKKIVDASLLKVARRLLAWTFDALIKEARASKIFVDKTGAPIRRTQPKKRLRMIR